MTAAKKQLSQLKKEQEPRRVMVLAEREEPRQTYVLVRGVWDAKGDSVQRAVLSSILEWPVEKTKTRLDFANWIVDAENPVHVRDLHATALHLLGIDHERFTHRYQGLDFKRTGVEHSRVVKEVLA